MKFVTIIYILLLINILLSCGGSGQGNSEGDSEKEENPIVQESPKLEIAKLKLNSEGYLYSSSRLASFQINRFSLNLDAGKTYRFVLRPLDVNSDLIFYDNKELIVNENSFSSTNPSLFKDEIRVVSDFNTTLYFEVISEEEDFWYDIQINVVEPYLESGFPVDTLNLPGKFKSGSSFDMITVGNIDDDPYLEILTSGTAVGPLYAWNHDGSSVDGFPLPNFGGVAYPSIGNLDANVDTQEIAIRIFGNCSDLFILDINQQILPGWPIVNCLINAVTPLLFDIDNDGVNEVFQFEHGIYSDGIYSDGSKIPGWSDLFSFDSYSITLADWDGGGDIELITGLFPNAALNITNTNMTPYYQILVQKLDGTVVDGFPTTIEILPPEGMTLVPGGQPVVVDLNNDGKFDYIRVLNVQDGANPRMIVQAIANNGSNLWIITTDDASPHATDLAVGDLDDDGFPEIVLQTDNKIFAWNSDGTVLAGWPITFSDYYRDWIGSSPVIADVNGDLKQDVIVVFNNKLQVYSNIGELIFESPQMGIDKMPAVADIDLDGRNEIIVGSSNTGSVGHVVDTVWVFDLGGDAHGKVEWGQSRGNSKHQGIYPAN